MHQSHGIGCLALPVIVLSIVLNGSAGAQNAVSYPFCAVYANKSGTPACYFATRQQCMADVSGVGGFCVENPSYHGPAATAPRRKSATRAHRGEQSH